MNAIPKTLQVTEENGVLVIQRRWRSVAGLGLVIFAVVWCGLWALFAVQPTPPEADPNEKLLVIPGIIVGGIAVYLALANVLNRTTFRVDRHRLAVNHAPILWPGRTFEVRDIEQVFVRRMMNTSSGNRRVRYAVWVQLTSSQDKKVVGDIESERQAEAIKQALSNYLGVTGG